MADFRGDFVGKPPGHLLHSFHRQGGRRHSYHYFVDDRVDQAPVDTPGEAQLLLPEVRAAPLPGQLPPLHSGRASAVGSWGAISAAAISEEATSGKGSEGVTSAAGDSSTTGSGCDASGVATSAGEISTASEAKCTCPAVASSKEKLSRLVAVTEGAMCGCSGGCSTGISGGARELRLRVAVPGPWGRRVRAPAEQEPSHPSRPAPQSPAERGKSSCEFRRRWLGGSEACAGCSSIKTGSGVAASNPSRNDGVRAGAGGGGGARELGAGGSSTIKGVSSAGALGGSGAGIASTNSGAGLAPVRFSLRLRLGVPHFHFRRRELGRISWRLFHRRAQRMRHPPKPRKNPAPRAARRSAFHPALR